MKIYEKPMAKIEMLNVEDVITVSPVQSNDSAAINALATKAGVSADNTIIFEW